MPRHRHSWRVKSCIMVNLDTCKLRVLSVSALLIRLFLFNLTVLWMLSNAEAMAGAAETVESRQNSFGIFQERSSC